MSTSRYFLFEPSQCAIFDSKITNWCLPEKADCDIPNDVLLTTPGNEYNCTECCDGDRIDYYIPFISGDEIHIQTQFLDQYNPDVENPVDGFGTWIIAEVMASTGIVIGTYSTYGAGFVGWSGDKSYQVLKLDTSIEEFPVCFQIRYKVYKAGDPDVLLGTYTTQWFGVVKDPQAHTLEIEGIYTSYDCTGQYYGESESSTGDIPFLYSNKLRFYGIIKTIEPLIEKTISSGRVISTKVTDRKLIDFEYPLPSFMVKYLCEIVLAANVVKIDNKFYNVTSIIAEPIEDTCSFHVEATISGECIVSDC